MAGRRRGFEVICPCGMDQDPRFAAIAIHEQLALDVKEKRRKILVGDMFVGRHVTPEDVVTVFAYRGKTTPSRIAKSALERLAGVMARAVKQKRATVHFAGRTWTVSALPQPKKIAESD